MLCQVDEVYAYAISVYYDTKVSADVFGTHAMSTRQIICTYALLII